MRFAICIEASFVRGMGHFYRALVIQEFLEAHHEHSVIVINHDEAAERILKNKKVPFEVVDYSDVHSHWEKVLVEKYHIDILILDKFSTPLAMAEAIVRQNVMLVAIDDCGAGAAMADLHFCSMLFEEPQGKKIFLGKDYLILNPEIAECRRHRTRFDKILVTLGGSDTYGVTVRVVELLKRKGLKADIAIGPIFRYKKELMQAISEDFQVYENVPSLIKLMANYDLAITGGGVTCFETSASGLPSIIIANEKHEVPVGQYIASFGGAKFAGYYKSMDEAVFDIYDMPIREMSRKALRAFQLNGLDNIYKIIQGAIKDGR